MAITIDSTTKKATFFYFTGELDENYDPISKAQTISNINPALSTQDIFNYLRPIFFPEDGRGGVVEGAAFFSKDGTSQYIPFTVTGIEKIRDTWQI